MFEKMLEPLMLATSGSWLREMKTACQSNKAPWDQHSGCSKDTMRRDLGYVCTAVARCVLHMLFIYIFIMIGPCSLPV